MKAAFRAIVLKCGGVDAVINTAAIYPTPDPSTPAEQVLFAPADRVTVIEHGTQLMGGEDPDVSEELQRLLGNEGIQFLLDAKIVRVHGRSPRASDRNGEVTYRASLWLAPALPDP